MTWPT